MLTHNCRCSAVLALLAVTTAAAGEPTGNWMCLSPTPSDKLCIEELTLSAGGNMHSLMVCGGGTRIELSGTWSMTGPLLQYSATGTACDGGGLCTPKNYPDMRTPAIMTGTGADMRLATRLKTCVTPDGAQAVKTKPLRQRLVTQIGKLQQDPKAARWKDIVDRFAEVAAPWR